MQKINISDLAKRLNDLCEILDRDYYINSGGCCYVSYLIAYYLEKLNIDYNFIVFSEDIKNYKSIQYEISNKLKNKDEYYSVIGKGTCIHYALSIKRIVINISDFHDGYKSYIIKNINSDNILWIYRNGHWNKEYNKRNNKYIRKIVKQFFKGYL